MMVYSFVKHDNEVRKNAVQIDVWNGIRLGDVVVIKGLGITGVVNELNEYSGTFNIVTTTTNGVAGVITEINPKILVKVQELENK